jgi:HK97 family phage major capsid protein
VHHHAGTRQHRDRPGRRHRYRGPEATTLQQELATTQRQALIASVALEKGLPANLARRLQGESSTKGAFATTSAMATQLSSTNATLLPPTITQGPIFAKASEGSAVQSLARKVPLSVNANTAIPVPMDIPEADWVGEGGVKPAAEVGVGVKQMTGKKLAVLIPVSEEVANTNPAGMYEQVVQDLPTALARAFDYACINGKSLRTGNAGPFPEYLAQGANTVALGTAAPPPVVSTPTSPTASARSSTTTTTSPGSPLTSG